MALGAHPRRGAAALRVAVLSTMLLLLCATPAHGHTELLETSPADGARVDDAPSRITATFSDPVTPVGDGVTLTRRADDQQIRVRQARTTPDRVVAVVPSGSLPPGRYDVRWRVEASDGHALTGTFTFAVRAHQVRDATPAPDGQDATHDHEGAHDHGATHDHAASDDAGTEAASEPEGGAEAGGVGTSGVAATSPLEPVSTGLTDLLVLWTVGSIAFMVLVFDGSGRQLARMARTTAAVGVLALLACAAQVVIRTAVTSAGVPRPVAVLHTLGGPFGVALCARAGGVALMVLAVALLTRQARAGHPGDMIPSTHAADDDGVASARMVPTHLVAATAGATAALLSYGLTGHSSVGTDPLAGLAIAVHVGAVAVWIGGLPWLAGLVRRQRALRSPAGLVDPVTRFARTSTAAVNLTLLSGAVLAFSRLGTTSALWTTGYGLTLATKLLGVAALLCAGAINHFVLIPRFRRRARADDARRLGRFVTTEVALSIVVIAATGALVHTPPPS